ncbi:hypothetical protein [Actinokineospora xionganensis]|uniref:Lipoprotein n=1 Tax=Actinokineospora xionganensis TaxID=2684470 RepID=A0ABR7LEI3_9PSEU|nr:hypothetical protein [Actinokineospora xionganensis]MBC6451123.1 hypothetical protein [Actinokineospora xionganensis]
MGLINRLAIAVCAVAVGVSGCAAPKSDAAPPRTTTTGGAVATPAATPAARPSEVETVKSPAKKPTTTTKVKPKSTGDNDVIGPFGWQTLRLGMSADAAEALGMLTRTTEGDGLCAPWPALPITALDQAVVSETHGVWAIHPKQVDWIHTPEGMRIGWTAAQVHATYPDFDPAHFDYAHGPTVAVPGNPKALYRLRFNSSRVLTKIILESRVDVCSV